MAEVVTDEDVAKALMTYLFYQYFRTDRQGHRQLDCVFKG